MKTRSGLRTMRESGLYVGACPIYGYQKLAVNKNQLVPDDNTAPVVNRIFNLKLTGMSAARIAEGLNQDGILSPLAYKKKNGLPHPCNGFADNEKPKWSASTVLRILKDETYTGTLVQGKQYKLNYKIQKQFVHPSSKWARCEKAHDAIINPFDFETVQRILLMDTRTSPGDDSVGLFSGLLICGCCGGKMTRKTQKCNHAVYRYYYCPTGKEKGCHAPVMITEDTLTKAVFKEMRQYALEAQSLSKQLDVMNNEEIYHLLIKKKLAFIESTQEELLQLRAFYRSLSLSVMKGVITVQDCADMGVHYSQSILQLEVETARVTRKIQEIENLIEENVQWTVAIAKLSAYDSFERADIVRLVRSITVFSKLNINVALVSI